MQTPILVSPCFPIRIPIWSPYGAPIELLLSPSIRKSFLCVWCLICIRSNVKMTHGPAQGPGYNNRRCELKERPYYFWNVFSPEFGRIRTFRSDRSRPHGWTRTAILSRIRWFILIFASSPSSFKKTSACCEVDLHLSRQDPWNGSVRQITRS